MDVDVVAFFTPINNYLVLFTPIATALSSVYIIFIGVRRLFRKKSKHEKYLILSSREINTSDGKETYTLTENDHIKGLTDENEQLKIQNKALSKQVTNARLITVIVMMGALLSIWLHSKFSKTKKTISEASPNQDNLPHE